MRKTAAKRIIWVLSLLACLALVYTALDYAVSDDTLSMTRVTLHDFYGTEAVDTLFVGSSHSIYAIDTPVLSEWTGKTFFSLTTSGMDFVQAYYTLKEALRAKHIPEVYLEISPASLALEKSNKVATFIITDYLRSPLIRAEMILRTAEPESFLNGFFRLRRETDTVPTAARIRETIEKKKRESYRKFSGNGLDEYKGLGHWIEAPVFGADSVYCVNADAREFDDFTEDGIQRREMKYLEKIIRLCRRKDADLHFFVCPFSDAYLFRFSEYEQVMENVRRLCAENGISFLDMNYSGKEYLDLDAGDFMNLDHVNEKGRDKITGFLVRYFLNPGADLFSDTLRCRDRNGEPVLAAGYTREVLARETGETGRKMRVRVFAYPDRTVPSETELTLLLYDGEKKSWEPAERIKPVCTDGSVTEFVLPYDKEDPMKYDLTLLDPVTRQILCTACTDFNME